MTTLVLSSVKLKSAEKPSDREIYTNQNDQTFTRHECLPWTDRTNVNYKNKMSGDHTHMRKRISSGLKIELKRVDTGRLRLRATSVNTRNQP